MSDMDFARQLRGERLTTAEIMYYMPDYRDILQTFVWQEYDLAPRFPKLIKFLDFWTHNLDGPLGLGARCLRRPGQSGAHAAR